MVIWNEGIGTAVRFTGINPGEPYVAKKNAPYEQLMICKEHANGIVYFDVSIDYPYDDINCYKVIGYD